MRLMGGGVKKPETALFGLLFFGDDASSPKVPVMEMSFKEGGQRLNCYSRHG